MGKEKDMLLAKLALGLGGTVAVAGAYTFHDGVMRVDEDHSNGRHVHVWVPAAVVPAAMHFVPKERLAEAAVQASPWLPTLRAVTKELRKYPEAELIDVTDGSASDHVRIRTRNGKLSIDVDEPGEHVHVACPLAVVEGVADELEANAPSL
jgi:hypothetical protein